MRKSRRITGSGILLVVLGLIIGACGGDAAETTTTVAGTDTTAAAPDDGETATTVAGTDTTVLGAMGLEALCAAAANEEAITAWLNFGNVDAIVADFREDYPDVDIEALTILPEDAAPRIVTETAAGNTVSPNVVYGTLASLQPLIERDVIDTSIDWEAAGVNPEFINDVNFVRVAITAYGIGYNTETLSAADLPNTWEGLIDEEWNGRLIIDPRGRPYSFLSLEWGVEETVDHVTRLMEVTDPILLQGTTAGLIAIASGEGDVLLNSKTAETQEQIAATGAPLAIKLLDVVPADPTWIGVTASPTVVSPNASQCFTAWLASEGGEASILEHDFKVNDLSEVLEPDANVVSTDTADAAAIVDETIEALTPIVGGEG